MGGSNFGSSPFTKEPCVFKAKPASSAGKAMTNAGCKSMTTSSVYRAVAWSTGLKPKDVKAAVEQSLALAAKRTKIWGKFKLAGMLKLKIDVKGPRPAGKGVNPFTKEPCPSVRITCLPKASETVFKVVHQVTWSNFKCCPDSWVRAKPFRAKKLFLDRKQPSAGRQCRTKKQSLKRLKNQGLKHSYHASHVLTQILARPGAFPRSEAPQIVLQQWPEKGYLKFTSVPDKSKLAFAVACILSAHATSEREALLKKAVAKKVVGRLSISKVRVAMVAARGAWTPAFLEMLNSGGRRGHK